MYPPTVADSLGQKQADTSLQSNCNHSAILLKYCMVSMQVMQHITSTKRRQKMVQQIQFVRDTTVIPGEVMRAIEPTANFSTLSSLRMSMRIRFKPAITSSDFVRQLSSQFPEIAGLMDESDFGILPLEIGAMTVATKEAIGNFDLVTVRRHLAFIGDLYERAEAELRKAIQIAYLENLFLGETAYAHVEARCLLSGSLSETLKKSESHFRRLAVA
jgi:hypothetical protein